MKLSKSIPFAIFSSLFISACGSSSTESFIDSGPTTDKAVGKIVGYAADSGKVSLYVLPNGAMTVEFLGQKGFIYTHDTQSGNTLSTDNVLLYKDGDKQGEFKVSLTKGNDGFFSHAEIIDNTGVSHKYTLSHSVLDLKDEELDVNVLTGSNKIQITAPNVIQFTTEQGCHYTASYEVAHRDMQVHKGSTEMHLSAHPYLFKTTEGNCAPIEGHISYTKSIIDQSTITSYLLDGFGEEQLQTLHEAIYIQAEN
ncbi:hypothetical protein [Thaumasiovibrio subtropicus]|uniref:hypothetical protein n=1 Tax=Thaumasiovibrio subtropicus TaxID=1891207 RepID=UPI000B34BC93|nr:hypothetical protein [Thaumasiovibrio subtropicus]